LIEENTISAIHLLEKMLFMLHIWEILVSKKQGVLSSKFSAAEPFIQAARQLQDIGLDINSVSPFLETVREKAQVERINVDVAAISVAQELRNYRINGGLQRQIEIAQGQLKMINITIAQKEKPLLILAEFQIEV